VVHAHATEFAGNERDREMLQKKRRKTGTSIGQRGLASAQTTQARFERRKYLLKVDIRIREEKGKEHCGVEQNAVPQIKTSKVD